MIKFKEGFFIEVITKDISFPTSPTSIDRFNKLAKRENLVKLGVESGFFP
jgi:hypothetical protein